MKSVSKNQIKNRSDSVIHMLAIEKANIKKNEKVLEVAVRQGRAFLEIMKRVGSNTTVHGMDISTDNLRMAEDLARRNGYSTFELREEDSRRLPFVDNTFDLLYNAYLLDLLPLKDILRALREFRRVLKPGGRLVLLNRIKKNETQGIREFICQVMPSNFVLYFVGGCSPVLMENLVKKSGFQNVSRTFVPGRNASEIILAIK